jgi:hypothetical protein
MFGGQLVSQCDLTFAIVHNVQNKFSGQEITGEQFGHVETSNSQYAKFKVTMEH